MRKIVPGFRFFECDGCFYTWYEICRDAQTPSGGICPECQCFSSPNGYELHEEWKTDCGNLIHGYDYGKPNEEKS